MNDESFKSVKASAGAYVDRSKARKFLVQMLYEFASGNSAVAIFDNRSVSAQDTDYSYLKLCFFAITEEVAEIDDCFKPHLDRDIERLGMVELSILRLATYELKSLLEIPYKVVIDEAVELAKIFASEDSHKFVNAVLDKVAKDFRQHERVA